MLSSSRIERNGSFPWTAGNAGNAGNADNADNADNAADNLRTISGQLGKLLFFGSPTAFLSCVIARYLAVMVLSRLMGGQGVFYAEAASWMGADLVLTASWLHSVRRLPGE